MQTCLRTIGLRPPQSNLVRDRCSASRRALGRGSTANWIKGTIYTAHTPALPFKDNLIESQVPTLASTSDQFRFSWRSGPNHILRMRTGPSLQRKDPGNVSLLVQAPSYKPSLLSKLTLAHWGHRVEETGGNPAGPIIRLQTHSNAFRSPAPLVVVHHANPSAELWLESDSLQNRRQKNDGQYYRRLWTDLNWSARPSCRLLTPLGSCKSSAGCLWSIFPSQRRSAQGRSNR